MNGHPPLLRFTVVLCPGAETLAFVVPPTGIKYLSLVGVKAPVLVERALRVGGWLCYATLVEVGS